MRLISASTRPSRPRLLPTVLGLVLLLGVAAPCHASDQMEFIGADDHTFFVEYLDAERVGSTVYVVGVSGLSIFDVTLAVEKHPAGDESLEIVCGELSVSVVAGRPEHHEHHDRGCDPPPPGRPWRRRLAPGRCLRRSLGLISARRPRAGASR